MSTVTLVSADGQEFVVPEAVADMSATIKDLMHNVGDAGEPVPLDGVRGAALGKVVAYCTHYMNEDTPPPPLEKDEYDDGDGNDPRGLVEMTQWDKDFCAGSNEDVCELMVVADYLNMRRLLDILCKTVADKIAGKTTEEIRTEFNITNDYTPEEEEQVRRENEWCHAT